MDDGVHVQKRYMEEEWSPPARVPRRELTPLGDFLWHSSLMACRRMLPADLPRHSMLIVNCGSGDDTHYFVSEGAARLAVSDVSRKALTHTRGRCGVRQAVAADTARLPFADGSFDWVGVRSGLHHLDNPWRGLEEMARVARKGVFFVEGHATPLTGLWVSLGLLEREEEAGNVVYRFRRREVTGRLKGLGFCDVRVRTAFFFQIPFLIAVGERIPGRAPALLARVFVRAFNVLFGVLGNCLVAVGNRPEHAEEMAPAWSDLTKTR